MKNSPLLAATAAFAVATGATATTSVSIVSAAQRWPWNNKVDITYVVEGGQTRAAGVYCGLRFTLSAGGRTYSFSGAEVGASAEDGTHSVVWSAPEGIVATDCAITATLFPTNVPSGNDYMIVDLDTGAVTYEGLFADQADSNARYNVDDFKTAKMVLRKIPRWDDRASLPNATALAALGGYPTGDSGNYSSGQSQNTSTTWTPDRDYYVGVFPVTQDQYRRIGADAGPSPSACTSTISGNEKDYRPVDSVSWNDLRRPTGSTDNFASTSSIPAVASAASGNFFQRLNRLTGHYFDLPTEAMFEISARAGATTVYSWGDTMDKDYVICKDNAGAGTALGGSNGSTVAVGSRLPNAWGLYDTDGNLAQWCLDAYSNNGWGNNVAGRPSPFSPAWFASGNNYRYFRGGYYTITSSDGHFRASHRDFDGAAPPYTARFGFRVALIAE